MTDLSALIERLEQGSGKDRWLDGLLAPIDPRFPAGWVQHPYAPETGYCAWMAGEFWPSEAAFKLWRDDRADIENWIAPSYSSSLDAALAFAEAMNVPWPIVLSAAMKKRRDDDLARLPRAVLVHTLYHHSLRALQAKDTP